VSDTEYTAWERRLMRARLHENLRSNPTTWAAVSDRLPRSALPAALFFSVRSGHLSDLDEIAAGVADAWTGCEFPLDGLKRADWSTLFDLVGFIRGDKRADRPVHALTLFRGSVPTLRFRWSWTTDREKAEWFAQRRQHADARVWTCSAPPSALLADFSGGPKRAEGEFVLNTRGLKITPSAVHSRR
jgi:hypothetical protein